MINVKIMFILNVNIIACSTEGLDDCLTASRFDLVAPRRRSYVSKQVYVSSSNQAFQKQGGVS